MSNRLRATMPEYQEEGDTWRISIQGDGHPPTYLRSDNVERLKAIAETINQGNPDHRLTNTEVEEAVRVYNSARRGRYGNDCSLGSSLEIVIRSYLRGPQ